MAIAASTARSASASSLAGCLPPNTPRVTAPMSGRISRRLVDPGNLVKADETVLANIVSLDPLHAYFDVDVDSVVGSIYQPWEASPRVGNMPLFDPRNEIDPGKRAIVFNNIISIWIDGIQGNEVVGRFLHAAGAVAGSPGVGTNTGPDLWAVRLVE